MSVQQNASNNTTVGPNGTGGSPTGGGIGIGIGNPADLFMDILSEFVEVLLGVGEGTIDLFNTFVFQIPAPGVASQPETWTDPNNGLWGGVYGAMGTTVALGVVMIAGAVGVSFLHGDQRSRRAAWRRCGLASLLLLLGIAVPAIVLHATNAVVSALAPSGSEFFQTPGNVGKLGAGVGLALVLGILQTAAVGGAIVVLMLERMLVYMTVYLWPLAWACYAWDGFVKSLGQTIIYLFGVVVAMKLVQALVVRLLFELPWGESVSTSVAATGMTVAGLGFALILFPKAMLDHANDAASVSLGLNSAHRQGGKYVETSMQRGYERIHDSYTTYRGVTESDDTESAIGRQSGRDRLPPGNKENLPASREHFGEGWVVGGYTPSDDVGPEGLDASELEEQRSHIDRDRGYQ
ncbi:hypothetical protein [Halomarina oriensis]|uniref:Conjugal transfer protein TrbL n=1 Tax=Halomarina oriensis TaxID=671145 RepID=A0A6B0GKX8_9EURY|nr:hypothetical protein [Halomarina oriensis]MWG35280.1 hypothetical protein [Halomarina oriensis]